jgi:uncharacterized protein (TIGR02001 family)
MEIKDGMQNPIPLGASLALAVIGPTAAADLVEPIKPWSAHIDFVSTYVVRGITSTYGNALPGLGNRYADAPESNHPVPQWGVDYVAPSGWYAGYWASPVNFSYRLVGESYDQYAGSGRVSIDTYQTGRNSIENDFYGGYNGKLGNWTYTVGGTGYAYIDGRHANGWETKLSIGYQDIALAAQTLLNDVVWGNAGDTYWTLNYSKTLPYELSFTSSLGWYTYRKEGKFVGTRDAYTGNACPTGSAFIIAGCAPGHTPTSQAFRHLILGIGQPIGVTGLNWGLQYIVGGRNRWDVAQGNKVAASLSYVLK